MNVFFSADYHLGHANIIKHDNRPFSSVEEMDKVIIDNHNSFVKPNDHFYFVGDITMDPRKADGYLSRLNGIKFFIRGNHDSKKTVAAYQKYGTYLGELKEIKIEEQRIVLCHYAMRVWNHSHRGAWHLYGHSHHSLWDDPNSLSIDVGINKPGWDYRPICLDEIDLIMTNKTWKAVDHHNL